MSSETPEEIILPATTNGETMDEQNEDDYLEEQHDPMLNTDADAGADPNENQNEESQEDVLTNAEEVDESEIAKQETSKNPVVPKKRKDSPTRTTTPKPEETDETVETETTETTEAPEPSTSHAAVASASSKNKDDSVDENQCRVCTTKEDLFSLFKSTEERKTVAEMMMTLCPSITIAQKDFMPQFVCYPCYGKITLAIKLKTQCETTERELRKKLSRHKNKVRRPVGYVVVDATLDSEPESIEEPNDDVEFKVSEASISADDDDDSEDSDFSGRKRPTRSRRAAPRKSTSNSSKSKKSMKRTISARSGDETSNASSSVTKRSKVKSESESEPTIFPCDQCNQIFQRKSSLAVHKRAHANEKNSYWCELCGKQFKIKGAYSAHLEKHKNESNGFACPKCDEIYVSNADLKRHLAEDHNEPDLVYTCTKCKRTFVSQSRLQKHTPRCPGTPKKKNDFDGFPVGQDLFKTVAPLTTTYWSDSFSD